MKFTCTITLADFQAAQALHWHQTILRRIISFSVYLLFPLLCSSLVIVLGNRMGIFLKGWSFGNAFVLGLIVSTPIALLISSSSKSKRFRKTFEKRYSPDKRTVWFEFSDNGITTAIVGTDAETIDWKKIVLSAQDDKITLLYVGSNKFLFFPISALTTAQRAELNDLITRNVSRKEK